MPAAAHPSPPSRHTIPDNMVLKLLSSLVLTILLTGIACAQKQPKKYKIPGYFGCYLGLTILDYPYGDDYAFLETEKSPVNGVWEMYGGYTFLNDKKLAVSIGGGFRNWNYFINLSAPLGTHF